MDTASTSLEDHQLSSFLRAGSAGGFQTARTDLYYGASGVLFRLDTMCRLFVEQRKREFDRLRRVVFLVSQSWGCMRCSLTAKKSGKISGEEGIPSPTFHSVERSTFAQA